MVADKGQGKYLVGISGRTLYTFASDTDDVSNCKDGCSPSICLPIRGLLHFRIRKSTKRFGKTTLR